MNANRTPRKLRAAALAATTILAAGIVTLWTAALSGASQNSLPVLTGVALTLTGLCAATICQLAAQRTTTERHPDTRQAPSRLRLAAALSLVLIATGLATIFAAAFSGADRQTTPVIISAILTFSGCFAASVCWMTWSTLTRLTGTGPGADPTT